MCIALFTTAHPSYALIAIDNRDEFILRPTSRPDWWKPEDSENEVISSRDLEKPERGTWMGITKSGVLAVLTNFREQTGQAAAAGSGSIKSRGGMVSAWLGGLGDEKLLEGVDKLLKDGGLKNVGGFSMACGRLRKNGEGLAIVSNRADELDDVPIIASERGKTWGLSNTTYDESNEWPKVALGKGFLQDAIEAAVKEKLDEEQLVTKLFGVLDNNTMPTRPPGMSFVEYTMFLRRSVLIPLLGDEDRQHVAKEAQAGNMSISEVFQDGMYGTQRQTILLVSQEGRVKFIERSLWDEKGRPIPKGDADVCVNFPIQGWDNDKKKKAQTASL